MVVSGTWDLHATFVHASLCLGVMNMRDGCVGHVVAETNIVRDLFAAVGEMTSGFLLPLAYAPLHNSVMEEICATGFRNPFRCGFDMGTDELYCGDVGHTNVEEIDIVE